MAQQLKVCTLFREDLNLVSSAQCGWLVACTTPRNWILPGLSWVPVLTQTHSPTNTRLYVFKEYLTVKLPNKSTKQPNASLTVLLAGPVAAQGVMEMTTSTRSYVSDFEFLSCLNPAQNQALSDH